MDDFLWYLRRCVERRHAYFYLEGFKQHTDKTYIGKLSYSMDWLGVEFNEHGATDVADRALRHYRERCLRLYEQACRRGLSHNEALLQVQIYRTRWLIWARHLLPLP